MVSMKSWITFSWSRQKPISSCRSSCSTMPGIPSRRSSSAVTASLSALVGPSRSSRAAKAGNPQPRPSGLSSVRRLFQARISRSTRVSACRIFSSSAAITRGSTGLLGRRLPLVRAVCKSASAGDRASSITAVIAACNRSDASATSSSPSSVGFSSQPVKAVLTAATLSDSSSSAVANGVPLWCSREMARATISPSTDSTDSRSGETRSSSLMRCPPAVIIAP